MPTPSRSAPELTVHEGGAGAPTPEPGPERDPGAEKAPDVTPSPAEFRAAGARWLEDEAYARAVLAYGASFAVTTFAVLTVWFNVLGGGSQPGEHTTEASPAAQPAPAPAPAVVAEAPPPEPAAAVVPEPEPAPAEPVAATPPPAPTPPPAATTPPTAAKPPAPAPSKPAATTAPATTASKPATTTSKPATTTSKPATTTSKPATTTTTAAAPATTAPPATTTTPPPAAETPPPAATTATSAAAPAPATLTGTYIGKTMGRTLALDLDFKPGGQLGGTIRLHDGTTAISVPASGTYSIGSDGTVTFSLTETGVTEPAVYSGTMIDKSIDGRVTVAGRSRGKFTAKR